MIADCSAFDPVSEKFNLLFFFPELNFPELEDCALLPFCSVSRAFKGELKSYFEE